MILQLSDKVPPELFKTFLYPREYVSSVCFSSLGSLPLLPLSHQQQKFRFKKSNADCNAVMRMRCVCKRLRNYIESLPNLSLKLSRKGATEADARFFSRFKSLRISSYWGWDAGWLAAAVEAACTGSVCIETLSISSSDQSLSNLVSILEDSSRQTIKNIDLSFYGDAHSLESSVECIKTLASIVGSIDIKIKLAVKEDLALPEDINHAFDILANIATCKSLHMKCEPPLYSRLSFSITALIIIP